MAQLFTYTKPNKLSLLHDQLIAAGVTPLRCEGLGDAISLTYPDGQAKPSVDTVVAAHDPSVLTADEMAVLETQTDRADISSQYAAAVTRLTAIVTDGSTYTAVQVRDAVVDLARIERAVLKLVRNAV
jgi:hypothetical protein